jgi:hypothetical protein
MRAIIHQVIKVYRLSFFLFVNIVFEGLIRLREGIEWPHSRMDVWETAVGRPPRSNAAMMLLFEGEEVDIIAASDQNQLPTGGVASVCSCSGHANQNCDLPHAPEVASQKSQQNRRPGLR